MFKKTLFVSGLVIFIISLAYFNILQSGERNAEIGDSQTESYGIISEGPIPCSWDVQQPTRVMSESKSQAILINLENSTPEKCESVLSLRAPGFTISPLKEEQKIAIDASKSGSLSWILIPQKSGSFEFTVSDQLNTKIFGVTVTNTFGLNVVQAKIASIIGTLFGPMFTIPWWWDRFRKKKDSPPN